MIGSIRIKGSLIFCVALLTSYFSVSKNPIRPVNINLSVGCSNAPTANAGGSYTSCASINLHGTIGGSATTGIWSSPTGGAFIPAANVLNAIYIPSTTDSLIGNVKLVLTTNNPLGTPCMEASDTAYVTILSTDDNNVCTTDGCNSITGMPEHSNTVNGSPGQSDFNACTNDVCQNGITVYSNVSDGLPGNDDNNACTNDWCQNGLNIHSQLASINDFNECTVDFCFSTNGVVTHTPKPDGSAGNSDNNACTNDYCLSGTTVNSAIVVDDSNPCTFDGCNTLTGVYHGNNPDYSQGINDGNACTNDICLSGITVNSPLTAINDGNPCTNDFCVTTSGLISHLNVSDGSPGEADGNACTDDYCISGNTVHTTRNIDDANACTIDFCDTASGSVTHNSNVDDNNSCTTDACNTLTGPSHFPLTGPANDNNLCTTGEACNNGVYFPGIDTPTDDGDICTVDICDSLTGLVNHLPAIFDDGNLCTYDYCDTLTGLPAHRTTPVVFLGNDTVVLPGDSMLLDAGPGSYYWWSTGANTQTIMVYNPGIYSVTVTNQDGCIGSDNIVISLFNNIREVDNAMMVTVFPNPTSGNFKLNYSGNKSKARLEIVNILNQTIYQEPEHLLMGNTTKDLSLAVPAGTYLIRLYLEGGIVQKHLVIHR